MTKPKLDPAIMQSVALALLVKHARQGEVRLTKEDFAYVDQINPKDQWTINVDPLTQDILIGFMPVKKESN